MKVETGTVTMLRITEVLGIDPIRVTLDDIGPGQGRINIECYGKAWASYWGAMGSQTIAEFFASCDTGYLIDKLAQGMSATRPSGAAMVRHAKRVIRHRRKGIGEWRDFPLSSVDAHNLMGDVHGLQTISSEAEAWQQSDLLKSIYGEDWARQARADEPNPEYVYLGRICDAVREAMQQIAQRAQADQKGGAA